MSQKKKNILFIEEKDSLLDMSSPLFKTHFESVERVMGEQRALKLIHNKSYDLIVNDISVEVDEGVRFMKQIKEFRPAQQIVTLVALSDEEKIGDLMENGIHAFVLMPEQFDQALETIAQTVF